MDRCGVGTIRELGGKTGEFGKTSNGSIFLVLFAVEDDLGERSECREGQWGDFQGKINHVSIDQQPKRHNR